MVQTIGGSHVQVTSILDNPGINPREFAANPRIGRALLHAKVVVMNGLGFDSWMTKLLDGTPSPGRKVIVASEADSSMILPDRNWHVFYSPGIMLATASQVEQALSRIDPKDRRDFEAGLQSFQQQLAPVYAEVRKIAAEHPHLAVTATVPVYGYMFRLLGFQVLYRDLQFANMNNSQPSGRQIAEFIRGLEQHKVHLLVYNEQVHNQLTRSLVDAARGAGVPVTGVSAIPLHGEDYAQWQLAQLESIEDALDRRP